jgi:V8-like Glu-specific endopeptidase
MAVAVAAFVVAPSVIAAGTAYRSAPAEPAIGGITPQQFTESMASLHGRLVAELPAGVMTTPLRLDLTPDERTEMNDRQAQPGGPAVMGRTKAANIQIRISDPDSTLVNIGNRRVGPGLMAATADGGFVWAGAIVSDGAAGMRVHFTGLNLPPDAELYVLNLAGAAYGPFRGRGPSDDGDFWAPTVGGAESVVMLRQRGSASKAEINRMSFAISEVGHIASTYRGISTESYCTFNEPCMENADCYSNPPTAGHKSAIAMLQWISGAFINTCTGGLVADTDTSTQIPYILTANHCISRSKDAKNVEAFFFHDDTPCGSSNCPAQANPGGPYGGAILVQPIGTAIKATGTDGDYSLLQLNGTPPSGTAYLGFSTAPVANTNGTALRRVHHPAWAPQAYSEQSVTTSAGTCSSLPRGSFIYSRDAAIGGNGPVGGTEGGSSGSPVVNTSNQIVGQLFGACGTNVNDACDFQANATVDGALAHYFPDVASFLDPQGGGCTPTQNPESSCSDGLDNDCDGLTDGADPDCGGGGCNLGQAGDSCTDNSDCCSNNCKGKPGAKTCK